MHADFAADDETAIGFPDYLERRPLARVFAHAGADRRRTCREGQKAARLGDEVAIRGGVGDLFWRGVALLRRAEHAQCDELAVSRRVRQIAGREKRRRRKAAAHRDEILGFPRQDISPRHALALLVGQGQNNVLPLGIEMAVVPGNIFFHDTTSSRVFGNVVDPALTDDPDLPAIVQSLPVLGAGSHSIAPRQ